MGQILGVVGGCPERRRGEIRMFDDHRRRRGVRSMMLVASLVFAPALTSTTALAVPTTVVINTAPLSSTAAQLAFDLIDNDGVVNNTVVISGFTAPGSTLGTAVQLGDVNGALPGPVTIKDTIGFGELLQDVILGNSLAFTIDPTTSFAGGIPDRFFFAILDPETSFSLVDTDLPSDALLAIDLNGTPAGERLVSGITTPNVPNVGVTVAVAPNAVPEPGTLALLTTIGPGIAWVAARHRRRG
jgi:hypothetical protein